MVVKLCCQATGPRSQSAHGDKKSLLLFKKLVADAGHSDEDLPEHMVRGFDLTDMLPESKLFTKRIRPAVQSCEELRRVAELGRACISQSAVSSVDSELDEQLYSATFERSGERILDQSP